MKSRMGDLNNHLFAQLEQLADTTMTPEQLEAEVTRSAAIVNLADQITEGAKLQLTAAKLYAEHGAHLLPYLPQFGTTPDSAAVGAIEGTAG